MALAPAAPAGAEGPPPAAPAAALEAARGSQIVLLGETHDNPHHHALQAAIVGALRPAAIVFEMLSPAQAARLEGLTGRTEPALREALGWDGSGWPDFAMYYPIFAAAPGAAVLGAGVPAEALRRAIADGAAAAFGPAAGRYGLEDALPPPELAARTDLQNEAHCGALPAEILPGMVEAQRLRDAAFARTALEALDRHGPPVVVIAGRGHVRRDWGIPAALAAAAPQIPVAAIALSETVPEDPGGRFDAEIVTPAPPREDPCAAFD
ncbi:ChaN family lipoprotein [Mangrovicoccus algicola]|uniref:ChaN family lipoprotein n=1 Tax=Mangrovicoccus algicola TaxID=2771008 RepID=A0A8J7CYK3_9RHOB|nr:ChaN family lipoprotein [Mangrovicoccus algicola]MBE3636643.1 ChaN family lipoprotein [Mangrovicoccus algicola]